MNQSSRTIQAFWVAAGAMSSLAISIVSSMVLARYLAKADLGVFRQVSYVYSTLAVLFMAGLPAVYAYFLPRFKREEGLSIIHKVSSMLAFTGLIFSVSLYFCADLIAEAMKSPGLSSALKAFSPVPLLMFPALGLDGIMASNSRTKELAMYNVISRLIMLACIVLPVTYMGMGHIQAIYGWVFSAAISLLMAFYFQRIPYRGIENMPCDLTYKRMLGYSIPILTAGMWGIALKAADQFLISRYFGPEVYAEYSLGVIEIPFVGMVTAAAATVLMPVFSKMNHDQNDQLEILKIWQSAMIKSATVIYPMVVFCFFFADEIIRVLYTDKFIGAADYFRIGMMINFFNIVVFSTLILSIGKHKIYSRAHFVGALLVWGAGLLSVNLVKSPILLATVVVSIKIGLILFFLSYLKNHFNFKFMEIFPVPKLMKITLCLVLSAALVKAIQSVIPTEVPVVIDILYAGIMYGTFSYFLGRIMSVDFMAPFMPVASKVMRLVK